MMDFLATNEFDNIPTAIETIEVTLGSVDLWNLQRFFSPSSLRRLDLAGSVKHEIVKLHESEHLSPLTLLQELCLRDLSVTQSDFNEFPRSLTSLQLLAPGTTHYDINTSYFTKWMRFTVYNTCY
jgi:hypothetical protein